MNQTRNYPEKMALKTTFEIIITKKNISNYDSKISVKKNIWDSYEIKREKFM